MSIEAARTSNSNQIQVLPNQPRQPQNLQGLLKFAMEATKSEDAPNMSAFQAMDEEVQKLFFNLIITFKKMLCFQLNYYIAEEKLLI